MSDPSDSKIRVKSIEELRQSKRDYVMKRAKELATAPKIQDDLKVKFGYGENKFFDLDLLEYRVNNSLWDIVEDLNVQHLYDIKGEAAEIAVNRAFRGYDGEHFPNHHFYGLLGKETNSICSRIPRIQAPPVIRYAGTFGG